MARPLCAIRMRLIATVGSENTEQVQDDVGDTVGNEEYGEQGPVDEDQQQNEDAVDDSKAGVGEDQQGQVGAPERGSHGEPHGDADGIGKEPRSDSHLQIFLKFLLAVLGLHHVGVHEPEGSIHWPVVKHT